MGRIFVMAVGMLAVAAYAAYLGQWAVEGVGIFLSIFSCTAYLLMPVDTYMQARDY